MSLVALVDGARALATKDGPRRGACAECGREMLARTGEIVTWHWAHHHTDDAPACSGNGETDWHLAWKARCADPDRIEVPVGRRRADVLTPYRWAVEFQHSSLDVAEVRSREKDWGRCLIWVVDGTSAREKANIRMWRPRSGRAHWTVQWRWSPPWVREASCRTFIDIGEGEVVFLGRWFEKSEGRPIIGYGWRLPVDLVAQCVLNGQRPPASPAMGQPLDPASWANGPVRFPVVDWSHRSHWGGGKAAPCHICALPALLRDDEGRPAHKVCVERTPDASQLEAA